MIYAAQVLTEAAMRLMRDPRLVARAREELREAMNGHDYECPIPPQVQPSIQPRPNDLTWTEAAECPFMFSLTEDA